MPHKSHYPFVLLTLTLFTGLILPVLIMDGMFMDGVLYTCVARNLAQGYGTFWFPRFSELGFAGSATFHEHPPLVFGIQSLFFMVLGSSIYVERFYSFLTAYITAWLIRQVWRLVTRDRPEMRSAGWLPVLLWIIIPVAFWAFRNNMQENTMGIFTLAAVWFILRGLITGRRLYLNLAAGGVMIFLASFSKGVPGLFPLAVPFWWWITRRGVPFTRVVTWTAVLLLIPAAIYALLMLHEPARMSLTHYAQARLLGRIHDAHTVEYRFHIVLRLLQELLVPLALTLIMLVMFRHRRIPNRIDSAWRSNMILLLLTGLSGSLPLMLTLVQKAFYFAHSLPFFGLGLAMAIAPGTTCLISGIRTDRRPFKAFTTITAVILTGVIVFSMMQHGKYSRNKELLEDVYRLGEVIAPRSMVSIDPEMWNQWDLQCYLVRHFNISADPGDTRHPWYLRDKNTLNVPLVGYAEVPPDLHRYRLYGKSSDSSAE